MYKRTQGGAILKTDSKKIEKKREGNKMQGTRQGTDSA